MNDRELLELAAKSAGYEYNPGHDLIKSRFGWHAWNPIDDDGDALRLAVALSLLVRHSMNRMEAYLMGYPKTKASVHFDYDHSRPAYDQTKKLSATRRAIVLAAAAIGEAMQ